MSKTIRIGGASGYWGDTAIGPVQLIRQGQVDYLIFDYLAEITMSILAKAQARDPALGYATDFIERVMAPLLPEIHRQGIKVIANAGGVNLTACRQALEKVAADAGLPLRIGTVEGDNLLPQVESVRALGPTELDTGAPLPAKLMSMNAYLGAFPIAAALDAGADIVLTGRCVDSALAVGPLIHEFGWRPDEYDRLAAGALVGHVIECGAQATGGNYSDWPDTVDGWDDTGFPIAEVSANGAFVLTKPRDTGGTVTPFTAGEQMLYEIGDPGAYVLPDVIADFRQVTLEQDGPDRVRIEGARGHAPTDTYKVSATYADGFGCVGTFVIAGRDAATKARRQGEAVLKKSAVCWISRNWATSAKPRCNWLARKAATAITPATVPGKCGKWYCVWACTIHAGKGWNCSPRNSSVPACPWRRASPASAPGGRAPRRSCGCSRS